MATDEETLRSHLNQRLPKEERLYLREEIERLYTRGRSFVAYPIRVVWLVEPIVASSDLTTDSRQAQVAVMTTAAKRRFKHAVDRNRIKRMTREAYRLHKGSLWQATRQQHCTVHLALQSVAKTMPSYAELERAVERAIARIIKEMEHNASSTTPTTRAEAVEHHEEQKLSLAVRLLSYPVKLYRHFISPLLPPSCRFTPTCSQYALEALRVHGALRGSWLTIWRVLRCNPFNRHVGYDPVPPRR